MNLKSLKRDDKAILTQLTKKQGKLYCSKPAKIYFPTRYVAADLALLDTYIYFYGLAMLVIDKTYMVIRTPTLLKSDVHILNTVMLDDDEMYELTFDPSIPLFETLLVQNGTLVYYSLNEFIIKGKIPKYVEYDDIPILFGKSKKFNDVSLFDDPIKMEIFVSVIARNSLKPNESIRHDLSAPMRWIGLGDKNYGYPDNLARLGGGYLDNALTTALTADPREPTSLEEQVLR